MKTDHTGAVIAILGSTGTGKTTFADHLTSSLHGQVFKESIVGNPFMTGAHHKSQTSFQNQLWFLLQAVDRWEQAIRVKSKNGIAVLDTYIPTVWLHSKLILDAPSIELLDRISLILTSHLPDPDILVYLFDDPEYIYHRLLHRHLPCDDVTVDYIHALTKEHESFLSTVHIPIIRIQSRILEDPAKETYFIKEIKKRIKKNLLRPK